MSAIISECGLYRYRLDRHVDIGGLTFAFFGVNGSTATADTDDATVRKWIGFSRRNAARRFIVGNAFGYRATDVRELAKVPDPVGPDNDRYIGEIIAEADVLVPCWGNSDKVPEHLWHHFDSLMRRCIYSGKPVKVFGWTKSNDPKHPLMLGYDTPLIDVAKYGFPV